MATLKLTLEVISRSTRFFQIEPPIFIADSDSTQNFMEVWPLNRFFWACTTGSTSTKIWDILDWAENWMLVNPKCGTWIFIDFQHWFDSILAKIRYLILCMTEIVIKINFLVNNNFNKLTSPSCLLFLFFPFFHFEFFGCFLELPPSVN